MTKLPEIHLKPDARRSRALQGHPWVYINELVEAPAEWDGQSVVCKDAKGRVLGSGLLNSRSQIAWRRFSRQPRTFNVDFLRHALAQAVARREEETVRRLVWSEADDLPGLVVDQYASILVVQALTLGIDRNLPHICEILQGLLNPDEILLRNDAASRELEGLTREVRTVSGREVEPFWCEIYGLEYWIDLAKGHKTGFYLDQRQEHFKVATMAEGARVLDAFCNQGAFGIRCALAGASEVVAIDASGEALAIAEKNAQRNQAEVQFLEANVFDYLTQNREERFDLIVLDPPSFARNKASLKGAVRGYKEINLRALRMLNSEGILATYSCSQHMQREHFLEVLREAARDAQRTVQILYLTGQPLDHPVRLDFPESEYLKGAILKLMD